MCEWLSRELAVPVIDSVAAATVLVESSIRMRRLTTSTRDEYARPIPKPYVGEMARFGLSG